MAIKLTTPGSVIFKQRRYGLDGREIIVYKFRTMQRDAEPYLHGDIPAAARALEREGQEETSHLVLAGNPSRVSS